MKANRVSALRRKRGLHRVNGAEPQVVGLTPQTTDNRKANTMKTYILRPSPPVEPQKTIRSPRPKTAAPLTAAALLEGPAAPKGPRLFLGLDVHNDSIAVSLAPSDSIEVRRYGIIGGEHDDVLKLAHKLQAAQPSTCPLAGSFHTASRLVRPHGQLHKLFIIPAMPAKIIPNTATIIIATWKCPEIKDATKQQI